MENDIIQIEYKKFSSFLKDYIKSFSRGHLFLISDEERSLGETFSFSIEAEGLKKPLKATGKVISSGKNESGESGVELEITFDEESRKFIDGNLKETVVLKYGDFWGTKLSALF